MALKRAESTLFKLVSAEGGTSKLDRWQRRLLDLSLRNSLLNYRLGRGRRFVELMCPLPDLLEDRLAEGEQFRLLPAMDILRQNTSEGERTGDGSSMLRLAEDLIHQSALLTPLSFHEMEARLITLYRAARGSLEETGANTLYLVFGFLSWRPANREKPCLAPLVLLPARLERQSVTKGFRLSLSDDEPRFNLTLLELLRRDFGLKSLEHLSQGLTIGEGGQNLTEIWNTVRGAVSHLPGWSVTRTVGLGLFSFAKYLMWRDLSDNIYALRNNDVARQILAPGLRPATREPFVEPEELDDKLPPKEAFFPLTADSSQLAAIASAAQGKDFVLFGPPGTGKSQTIAGMIAQALAMGRSVLFVAEKAAALEMVYKRLEQIGLGDFCLQLHSRKAAKREVLKQLEKAAQVTIPEEAGQWNHLANRLTAERDRLNEYVRQLHQSWPNGLTPFKAMGLVLNNQDCPAIPMAWSESDYHDHDEYLHLVEVVKKLRDLGGLAREIGRTALDIVQESEWSPLWEENLIKAARELHGACVNLRECAEQAAKASGLPLLKAEGADLTSWLELVRLLPLAWGHDWTYLLRPEAEKLLGGLSYAAGLLAKYGECWEALSMPYLPEVLDLDLDRLSGLWAESEAAWGPRKSLLRQQVKMKLKKCGQVRGNPDCGADLPLLRELAQLRSLIESCHWLTEEAEGLWYGFKTRLDELEVALDFAARFNDSISHMDLSPEMILRLNHCLTDLLGSENDHLAPAGKVVETWKKWSAAVLRFWEAADALKKLAASDYDIAGQSVAGAAALCAGLVKERPRINIWCAWLRNRDTARDLGLGALAAAIVDGTIEAAKAPEIFEVNYARWWTPRAVEELPALLHFVSAEHESTLAAYKDLDEEMRRLSGAAIASRLRSGPALDKALPEEWASLQRELARQRRQRPVRKLLSDIPNLVRKLTPCLLMSPLSIAQYLKPENGIFDLLIFDEASQIAAWDAAGALARANRVVVVGDPKQLPPSDFLQKTEDAEIDDDLAEDEMESIVDECVAAGVPSMSLRWHYRSRHESLIDFSNQHYYNGELITFPSAHSKGTAISFHKIDGTYERGGSRANQAEARAVVAAIVRQLESQECRGRCFSLGVVAFNRQQQQLIEDLLDGERRRNPDLDRFFDSSLVDEPVLVKNLENIQGDERDVMFFSVNFGPDITGLMTTNFGVLNKRGGERRLNVAATRARFALRVFCSFKPEDIDLNRTSAKGVHDLYHFLTYARGGGRGVSPPAAPGTCPNIFSSPLEAAISRALEKRGWQVVPKVGASCQRVALGVINPAAPDRFLAGIETDGLAYKQSATTRDREKLRESVLRSLGWNIIRAWSIEWWINPDAAANRLHQRLRHMLLSKKAAAKQAMADNNEKTDS